MILRDTIERENCKQIKLERECVHTSKLTILTITIILTILHVLTPVSSMGLITVIVIVEILKK